MTGRLEQARECLRQRASSVSENPSQLCRIVWGAGACINPPIGRRFSIRTMRFRTLDALSPFLPRAFCLQPGISGCDAPAIVQLPKPPDALTAQRRSSDFPR